MAEHGVRIYGAASMGALRAAELDTFGMVGIGKIYESYRIGRYTPFTDPFEDDDEVAVRHGPPEAACVAVSDAMVDVRETLAAAEAEGLISLRVRDKLAAELKRLHFPERSLGRLEQAAAALPGSEGAALVAWLRAGHAVSQKRRDAEALLRRLAAGVEAVLPAVLRLRARASMGTLPRRCRCRGHSPAIPGGGGVAAMPGGTRFLLFPQYAQGLEPEVVEIDLPPGAIGPGPQDSDHVCRQCDRQAAAVPGAGSVAALLGPAPSPAMPGPDGHFGSPIRNTPQFLCRASLWGRTAGARSLAGPARPADRLVARARVPAARAGAVAALGQRTRRPRLP